MSQHQQTFCEIDRPLMKPYNRHPDKVPDYPFMSVSEFHTAYLEAKTMRERIRVMDAFISQSGGWNQQTTEVWNQRCRDRAK